MRATQPSIALALLLAVTLGLAAHTAARSSLTADEPNHVANALFRLLEGRCCPGLTSGPSIALNGLLLLDDERPGRAAVGDTTRDPWTTGRTFLLAQPSLEAATWRARLPSLALLGLLVGVVFGWSRSLYGTAGASLSGILVASSPALLAHGGLATTDIHAAFAMTLAAFCWSRFHDRPDPRRAAAAAATLGLALCTKFSALALLPAFALSGLYRVWTERAPLRPRGAPEERAAGSGRPLTIALFAPWLAVWAAIVVAAFGVVWLAYGATLGAHPIRGATPTIPVFADYAHGLRTLRELSESGWPAYLLGQHGTHGWWYYFPIALAVKTPLWALAAWTAAALLSPWIRGPGARREVFVWLPAAIFFAASLTSNLNIGARHLLPLLPLLHVFAGRLALLRLGTPRLRAAAFGVLAASAALGIAGAHPTHLGYFNALAGGPAGGWRVLADSNVDWGQDLAALGRFLAERGDPPIRLAYFGPTPPSRYGIRRQPLPSIDGHPEDPAYVGTFGTPELVAISRNNLLEIDPRHRGLYAWLRAREPIALVGSSIVVYDITHDTGAHRELVGLYERAGRPGLAALERRRIANAEPR